MSVHQLLAVLRLRWWVPLLALVVSLAGGAAFVSFFPKRYVATVSVMVETKTDPLLVALAPSWVGGLLATQADIIRSDRVATRVVKMLRLSEDPVAVSKWREETDGRVPLETYYADALLKRLVVEPRSQIINISFTARDAKLAAEAANAFARAYIDLGVELKIGPAREYARFFDERLIALRTDLEAAQARVAEFQKKRGILVSNEKLDAEASRLASLEVALDAAIAQSADISSRARGSGTESSVDVQQSAAVLGLRADLARAETKLNEISTTYGPNHPVRIQLEAQISELKQQLGNEMRRVSAATVNLNRVSSQKISELRALVETQKKTVISMRGDRDEAAVILKNLETAQRAYDQVAQRRAQLSTEAQADQAVANVLSPAVEPLEPTFPTIPKVFGFALAAGLALGVGAVIGWELLDQRIRTVSDLDSVEDVPLLGVLGQGKNRSSPILLPSKPPGRTGPPLLTLENGPT